jgi:hypothetical protein
LTALVTSIRTESKRFHETIIPLVENSLNPESSTVEFLVDDGLDLWSALIAQAEEPTNDLLGLVTHLRHVFELASETLRKGLEITNQYVLLAPQKMLEQSLELTSIFRRFITNDDHRHEARGPSVHIVNTMLQVATSMGQPAVQQLAQILDESNFLSALLLGLKIAYDSHQATGPDRPDTNIDGIVETDYFTILARILVVDPVTFSMVIASSLSDSFDNVIDWILTEWFYQCENVGNADQKKLMCLALTNILDLGPKYLGRLQEFMNLWCDTANECLEWTDGEVSNTDCLVYGNPNAAGQEWGFDSAEAERKVKLLRADPVHTVHIKEHIRAHLIRAIEACGGQQAFQNDWLVNVDKEVVKSFESVQIL